MGEGAKGRGPLAPSPNPLAPSLKNPQLMRIAILRQRISGFGGAETTLAYLARGLARAGHQVSVYAAAPGRAAAAALGPGIALVPVPVWGGKTGQVLAFAVNSRRLLAQAEPQVVFSLERTPGCQVYRAGDGCHREWLARRQPYLSPAGRAALRLSPFHRLLLYLERRLFTHPGLARVIANSRQVREEIIRHYRVNPAIIRVIYNGLDHHRFHPLPEEKRRDLLRQWEAPPAARVLLFLGSGFRRKGLAYLIEAFATLKDKDRLLWVVGKGAPGRYQELARRRGVADRVRFFGPQADVAPFYQAAAVLALPTLYDPCSNVVLEALACGTPVVTTGANGAKEFLTPGENGAIVPQPDDLTALAAALSEYTERGSEPRERQAAAAAVAHLNWETTVAQTLTVLEEAAEMVGGGGQGPWAPAPSPKPPPPTP